MREGSGIAQGGEAGIDWQSRDHRRAFFAVLSRSWDLQARRQLRPSHRSGSADHTGTGDLERLMRNKAMQARYDKWMNGIKARYGSTGGYCALCFELRVTLPSCRLSTCVRYHFIPCLGRGDTPFLGFILPALLACRVRLRVFSRLPF